MSERVCLFMADFSGGGAERVMVNVANGLAKRGYAVDLVVARESGPYRPSVSPIVNVLAANSRFSRMMPFLRHYLAQCQPQSILTAGEHACALMVIAKSLSGVGSKLVLSIHKEIRAAGWTRYADSLKYLGDRFLMKSLYPKADRIVTVSEGVRLEAIRTIGGPEGRYVAIPNPIVSESLFQHAGAANDHPWVRSLARPVILAVGRLVAQKGFDTLLKALAMVRQTLPARLILLGDGPNLSALEAQAQALGIQEWVDFAGFVDNPYTYMRRADALVMSSLTEGFGNVLVEAMALGTPVVSTDCPHGPREILAGGEYGPLVPVNDPARMAAAIVQVLRNPVPGSVLMRRAQDFTIDKAIDRYVQALELTPAEEKATVSL